MKNLSVLDLRLMLTRQPLIALLLGLIVLLTGVLLIKQPPAQPMLDNTPDSARTLAAQRDFHAILIPLAELTKAQQAMLDSAAGYQLIIGRVEYAMENEAGAAFGRASMNLPVTGPYVDIRAFIASALASQPAMVLRHLSIQRENTEAGGTVSATLNVQFLVAGR
jgi:hypothetical protein